MSKLKHEDQTRRRGKGTRSEYVGQNVKSETESSSDDEDTFLLDDWDNWLDDSEV